ncbi:Hypothetical_protein [Hexamita inflata]|uniref:Hypothetical_protein n=1 Tax=Hexamita inflata TaxID=28002 RepID=A0AA86UQN0_9EUKA|nr:Hypothetical protein HINF_LOCUS55500 [Hexamita inflata]
MKGNPKVNTSITLGDPSDFAANQTYQTDAFGKFTAKSVLYDTWDVYSGLTHYTDVQIEVNAGTNSLVQTIKLNPKSAVNTGPNTGLAIGLSIFFILLLGAVITLLCMYAMKKKIWCFKASSNEPIQLGVTQVVKYDLSFKQQAKQSGQKDKDIKPKQTTTKVQSSQQKQNFNEIKAKFASKTEGYV